MRLAIAAFIAGGSLLLFLPTVPDYWLSAAVFTVAIALLGLRFFSKATSSQHIFIILICAALGFAWNAKYADDRLNNILSEELEGQELSIEGRVAALPQSSSAGAKFAFEVRQALLSGDKVEEFPERIYLSCRPAWRNAHCQVASRQLIVEWMKPSIMPRKIPLFYLMTLKESTSPFQKESWQD